jgi:hypothetical protein
MNSSILCLVIGLGVILFYNLNPPLYLNIHLYLYLHIHLSTSTYTSPPELR